jgi:hypothetical protein
MARLQTSPASGGLATLVLGLALVAGPAFGAQPLAVPLTLRSTASSSLQPATFSVGVPLPRGAWRDGSEVVLVDGEQRVPAQIRVLGRWPDDSARWILADWQAPLGAGESRRARLEIGAPATARSPAQLHVAAKQERVQVDTGARRFVVPRSGPDLLAVLGADGAVVAALRGFAAFEGGRFATQGERKVDVMESGPWRVRVGIDGTYGTLHLRLRIDFFAGQGAVRILHTIENHDARPYLGLEELGLLATSPGRAAKRFAFSTVGGSPVDVAVRDGRADVVQIDADTLRVGGESRTGRADGWFRAGNDERQTAVVARFFWQEYPQGVGVDGDELVYRLRADDGRPLPLGSGAAKTHELWLLLDGSPEEARALAARRSPPLAWIDPVYVRDTGALRNAVAPGPATESFLARLAEAAAAYEIAQGLEEWDDSRRVTCSAGEAHRQRGAYGMLNWGDWNFRGYRDNIKGCDAWGNLEYDTTQVLGLGWVATGNPQLHETMTAAARHFADVDTIHFHAQRRNWVGMNHPKNPLHFTFELGGVDLGHTWNEGLFTYGFLTGDDRVLATARGIADYLVQRRTAGVGFRGNPRQWGWPQVALVAAWENTGDERYREAALWFGQRGSQAHRADDVSQWKTGVLAEALAYTHAATGDPALRSWLETYATAVLAARPPDPRYYPALAYIGSVANREEWRAAAREAVDRLRLGRWGKPMTIGGRLGLSSLYWLETPPQSRAAH